MSALVLGAPASLGLGVAVWDDGNLDTVLGAELSGEALTPALDELEPCSPEDRDKLACSGDVDLSVFPEPALSHDFVLPSPSAPLAHIAEGDHALGFLEVIPEPLPQVIELGEILSDKEFHRVRDVREGAEGNTSDDVGGMLEPHISELLALWCRRRYLTPNVSGEAESTGHVSSRIT
jgi:hypothetical protein